MIKVKALTGPFAGRVREMPSNVNPPDLLASFLAHGWEWEIDYSQATGNEAVRWGRADMTIRVVRAIQAARSVQFMGKVYTDPQKLEDAVVAWGCGVSIARDDETGLEIAIHGQEEEPWATLGRAQRLIAERMPNASERRKDAFARAVAALVAGLELGVVGGPTVREHAALRLHGQSGRLTFEVAVEALIAEDGVIFGTVADLHRQCWVEEFCFEDDPEDVAELKASTEEPE